MRNPTTPITLYRHPLSGHAHRVELFLSILGLPFSLVDVDILGGAQREPAFLAKNRFAQVPVIDDGEVTIADSNAILAYLASRYDATHQWLPRDPVALAEVQRWLSVAAGRLVSGPGAARLARLFGRPDDPDAHAIASALFSVMNHHLSTRAYFAAPHPTIADIALYSYTRHAPEGGISLEAYPVVRAWLERIEALPGFVPMATRQSDAAA